jgi:hypothetical protein
LASTVVTTSVGAPSGTAFASPSPIRLLADGVARYAAPELDWLNKGVFTSVEVCLSAGR